MNGKTTVWKVRVQFSTPGPARTVSISGPRAMLQVQREIETAADMLLAGTIIDLTVWKEQK